jgi:hypothetical protein
MVYQFVVYLKNTQKRAIDRFSLLLLAVSCLLFSRELLFNPKSQRGLLLADMVILILVVYEIYRNRKTGRPPSYLSALLIAGMGWAAMPILPWLSLPFLVLGLLEKTAKAPLEIGFCDKEVVINSLIRRRYPWSAFNNIILKDNLLTLDFTNNRLLQRETEDEEGDAEEDEFNDYCRARLAGHLAPTGPPEESRMG